MTKINENSKEGFKHEGGSFVAAATSQTGEKKRGTQDKHEQQMLTSTKSMYIVMAQFAYMLIMMPYRFISQGINMFYQVIQQFNEIIKPIQAAFQQFFNVIQGFVMQIYIQVCI